MLKNLLTQAHPPTINNLVFIFKTLSEDEEFAAIGLIRYAFTALLRMPPGEVFDSYDRRVLEDGEVVLEVKIDMSESNSADPYYRLNNDFLGAHPFSLNQAEGTIFDLFNEGSPVRRDGTRLIELERPLELEGIFTDTPVI